jgi:sugar O-acyltransferase (sialic acid O-acetyltransferase NeuD family)
MLEEVYLVGAGGHVRSLINILDLNGFKICGIYDDNFKNDEEINSYRLVGKLENIEADNKLILAVGGNKKRELLFYKYYNHIIKKRIVHPSAIIEENVKLGRGNQVFAGVYINTNAKIGDNNILNTKSIIEHEVVIGNHNHISVGTILCGRVRIGNNCFIGAGAVIIDKVLICDAVIVGANSVVVKDIVEPGTYVGNPVRKIK